ncbi:bacterial proteasome activator family protein [Nocardioides sp.]|uniref:bacterial proteasome activator family protein n=1 Tax=Nocardioides sp. TaxID=35761 RepID=UPI003D10AC45
MSDNASQAPEDPRITVIGPDGMSVAGDTSDEDTTPGDEVRHVTDLVEQPAKVMRIGSMIRQLLEEVKAAPLDEAGRTRLAALLEVSVTELKDGLAPELDDELNRLVSPFSSATPTESELRIAQAQLVGWLEGLFHGIQTAIYAQQVAARAQLEQMRALPPGMATAPGNPGDPTAQSGQEPTESGGRGGMYL